MTDTSPVSPPESPVVRWCMLAIVSAGFIVMTINWFNISTGFVPIAGELKMTVPKVAFLISVFVATYGILHIPGGFLATKWGLRRTLAVGLAIEGSAALLSATAHSFAQLVIWRGLAGVGASVFAAVGIAAVSVWFREDKHSVALGISSAAFSVGTALGLYTWADITNATSWRTSIVFGGILALVVAATCAVFFRVPSEVDSLAGVRITKESLKQTLGNRTIWQYGFAFLGAYGAYIGAAQLLASYGAGRGISHGEVSAAAFLVGIAGVPGSVVAGWLADRYLTPVSLFRIGAALEALFLMSVPLTGAHTFWIPAVGIGFMFNFTFAVWQTVPGNARKIAPENIGTAIGLMLSIAAIGGTALPWIFNRIVPTSGGYQAAWIFMGVASLATVIVAAAVGAIRPPAAVTPTVRSTASARKV